MAVFGWIIPAEYLIIIDGMRSAHFFIIFGPPDIELDSESALAQLPDKPSKAAEKAFFHGLPNRAKPLRMTVPFSPNDGEPTVPLIKRLFHRIRNIGKVIW
jgi:hypothetical protein